MIDLLCPIGYNKDMGIYKNRNYNDVDRQRILAIRCTMIDRCTKPYNNSYKIYGGRGIKVCDEWLNDKESFYKWSIEHGYSNGLQIDRINPDGNYEPSNCRWITSKENNNNRRNNKKYEINGEIHTLSQWSDIYDMPFDVVQQRIQDLKWDVKKALTTPIRKQRLYTFNGETHNIAEWSRISGVNKRTLKQRLDYGYTIEEAIKNENFMTNGNRTKRKRELYGTYHVTFKDDSSKDFKKVTDDK